MTKISSMKSATRLLMVALILVLAFGTLSFAQGQRYKSGNWWSFGVMGDTQWTNATDPEGKNPEYVSASIAGALQEKFTMHGVKFVVQIGDLSDRAGDAAPAARATAAQPLFDAGIGFFPLRGNHETYGALFGRDPNYDLNIPAFKSSFPQTQGEGPNLFGAANFSWPSSTDDVLKGLSYAFDYNNASFVAVDVEQSSVKLQTAPNNPDSCVAAITGYGGAPAGSSCGQGYYYILSHLGNYDSGFVVYQAQQDTIGVTNTYDSAGNQTASSVVITIPAGAWFRIDSSKRPSTNFYAWDIPNPDQLYNGAPFDINDPPSDPNNRILLKASSSNTEFWPGTQQSWINSRLDKNTRGTDHAFVFSHRGMMGANHADGFFGSSPASKPDQQNPFYASLVENGVRYMLSAHDHIHNRALVKSPDGLNEVQQIIHTGASTKFYTPASLDTFSNTKQRETQISQELRNIGYYIYSVDGPRVTVDYYSDATGNFMDDANYPYGDASIPARLYMPKFNFVKKETYGYSTNGQQFAVPQGDSFTVVEDGFNGTTAKILAGTNNSTTKDYTPTVVDDNDTPGDPSDDITVSAPRALTKVVNTGWVANPKPEALKSDILSLWGLSELGANGKTDVYVLQMNYSDQDDSGLPAAKSGYRLATVGADGKWVRAVDANIGGSTKTLVRGPYDGSLEPGTQGVDGDTVWAVVNYDADFAVYNFQLGTRTSAFIYNRTTKKYTATLTLTNTSEETINQVYVRLTNLTAGAALANATGTANGSPYISKSFPSGLKPGASVNIPLSFTNTSNAKISFVPVTYSN